MNPIQKIVCKVFKIQPEIKKVVRNVIVSDQSECLFFRENLTKDELKSSLDALLDRDGDISLRIGRDVDVYRHVPLSSKSSSRMQTFTAVIKIKETKFENLQ